MRLSRSIWLLGIAIVGLIILLAPVSAIAQSCALCYTQAASSGSRMIQALKSGILILIAPPTFMSIGLLFVCYRKRNKTRDVSGESDRTWKTHDSDRKVRVGRTNPQNSTGSARILGSGAV
ncbi:MAG: hypothetical protein WB660_00935 [Candidatus Sulfotelmatobacter sp.]